jgi:hypothetical protein
MQKAVQVAFGLTEDDIKANSAGRLAKIQRRKLIRQMVGLSCAILLVAAISGLLLIGGINLWPVPLLLLPMLVMGFSRVVQLGTDLAQGRVGQVEGRIQLKPLSQTAGRMQIENLTFNITTAQLLALRNEMPYTVYFSPRSKVLLAAAPIQEDEVEPSELASSELLLDDEKPKRGQVALGDDGELIDLETPRSKQCGA